MTSSITCDGERRRRVLASATVAAAALLGSAAAPAQTATPKREDPAAAQALFKSARQLVDKGNYAEGCPQFEASLALYPSASTMLNVAQCHEHDGKLASAWEAYNQALTLNHETKGEERRKGLESLAKKGIAALEPRLPKLLITIKDAPRGLKVQRDGKDFPAAALSTALPADPGPHKIDASAPGYRDETRSVTLEPGKTATVEIALQPAAPSGKDTAVADKTSSGGVPTWAWIAGAGGLALSGAAAFFLADDLGAIHALRDNCHDVPGGTYCPPNYDYQRDNARKNRDLPLFIGLGSSGVLAIGAAIVGIAAGKKADTEPPKTTALPWLVPGGAGATVGGRF
jgi:tetratricopeptide (TPR) repeat protein